MFSKKAPAQREKEGRPQKRRGLISGNTTLTQLTILSRAEGEHVLLDALSHTTGSSVSSTCCCEPARRDSESAVGRGSWAPTPLPLQTWPRVRALLAHRQRMLCAGAFSGLSTDTAPYGLTPSPPGGPPPLRAGDVVEGGMWCLMLGQLWTMQEFTIESWRNQLHV